MTEAQTLLSLLQWNCPNNFVVKEVLGSNLDWGKVGRNPFLHAMTLIQLTSKIYG